MAELNINWYSNTENHCIEANMLEFDANLSMDIFEHDWKRILKITRGSKNFLAYKSFEMIQNFSNVFDLVYKVPFEITEVIKFAYLHII